MQSRKPAISELAERSGSPDRTAQRAGRAHPDGERADRGQEGGWADGVQQSIKFSETVRRSVSRLFASLAGRQFVLPGQQIFAKLDVAKRI